MPTQPVPLSDDYTPTPYWWDDVALGVPGAAERRPLPAQAEAVVVGAGYTGLSAARALAGAGRDVVVVDRAAAGTAASGRNGGMAHAGGGPGLAAWLARPDGRSLWDETVAAYEGLERLAGELDADIGWQRTGHLVLAAHPRHVRHLEAEVRAYASVGEAARLLGRDELGEEIGSSAFHGGLLVERSAAVQPARLAAALASAAVQAGAQVHEGVEVIGLEQRGGGETAVHTSAGTVRSAVVLVCSGAGTGGLVPWIGRRVLPVGSYLIATEPLEESLARSVSPRGRMFFDTRNFLNYWRLSPDGRRLLFGGRTSFGPTTVARARDELGAAMCRVHPQLAGVRVARAWGGEVDVTGDRTAHAGVVPATGLGFAMGYSGTGVALSVHLGAAMARAVAGEGSLPAFAATAWRRLPLAARVPGLLPVAGWWYRGRDLLGR